MALPDAIIELHPGPSGPAEADIEQALGPTVRVRLWDLPLRIFHWSLLTAVAAAIVTGKLGGDWMVWHGRAGIAIVALLAFRLVWGLIGPSPARFGHFAPTPAKIWAYLKGRWQGTGHNPLGALSVFALLGLLAWQATSGLFGNDDIAFTGPLAAQVSDELSHSLTGWHRQSTYLLYGLIGMHVLAIAVYSLIKKHRIVQPMLTGWADLPTHLPQPRRARRIALPVAVLVAAGASYAASGAWIAPPSDAPRPAESTPVATQGKSASPGTQQAGASTAGNTPSW